MTEQGRLLGERYELGEVLGRGGMAEVRLGKDIRLGRTVAVKTLRSDLALDSTFQQRFRKEAQSAASLNNPTIVSVYDTGEDYADGVPVPYIVMEYVDGQTLRELLASGRKLLPERAMEIVAGVLTALDYSHQAGIVHRDIKPGNVMLTRSGTVKVMDFGIARAIADASATMTATAAVIGTAQYLSPEQAKGEKVDARSDLYSAGCLLYELLTGQPPFTGDSPVSVAYQHVRENPKAPSSVDAAVTPAMDAIVLKSLAKNPENRYQSATEMREDIERALDGRPISAPAVMTDAVVTEQINRRTATSAMPPVSNGGGDRRRGGFGWVFLLLAVIAVAVLGVLVGKEVLGTKSEKVAVPLVQGLTQEQAEQTLDARGLKAVVTFENDPNVGEGRVIKQDPAAQTTLSRGDSVNLVVSQGEVRAVVPEVIGLPVADARKAIKDANLVVGKVTQRNSDRPNGEVLETNPKPGTKQKLNTRVDLFVSNGVALVPVPNVVGLPYATAYATMTQAGFLVPAPSQEVSDRYPPGYVLRQVPEPGQQLPKNSNVTFVLTAEGTGTQPTPEPTPTPLGDPTPTPVVTPAPAVASRPAD
ncbi:Stk1 family PASTA domain-containing Ser/Thr kinase [Sporichthya sp.]|uniref:Stk1 family PASTA domain-containing Ser/Thr kinase n=1 Tax=Sporichthya sp. TaxID=65475 RepID=UPI00183F0344|nr:Stk1 family PASTA domain-containing Ser/Thr kinase [Sporichthya sp.]MBA3744800.1 Stk1 family PASTA domain-containing Ser/Thr kinase [Sporichthya sp.]